MENKIFEYKKKLGHTPHGRGVEETHIVDAEQGFVLSIIAKTEFGELFGGYLLCNDAKNVRYIGVWGKDKVRDFKRILRERGVEFEVCKIDGTMRRILETTQDYSSRLN